MVTLGRLKHFLEQVETHPLLHVPYPIVTSPWPWFVAGYGIPHNACCLGPGLHLNSGSSKEYPLPTKLNSVISRSM